MKRSRGGRETAMRLKLGKPEKEHLKILIYLGFLLLLSIPIKDLLADAWTSSLKGVLYGLQAKTGIPIVERWKGMEVLTLGIFIGMLAATSWLDHKKRLQAVLLLSASSMVMLAYAPFILSKLALLFAGAAIGAGIIFVYSKESSEMPTNTKKCELGIKVIYWIGSIAINVAIISVTANNVLNRNFDFLIEMPYPMYIASSAAFVMVLQKFTDYEISSAKVMVVGPYRSGKTVFMAACYNYAAEGDTEITIELTKESPTPDLRYIHDKHMVNTKLTMETYCWPPPTEPDEVREYKFTYTCGTLFRKDVELIAYDYSGEHFDNILKYLQGKKEEVGEIPRKVGEKLLEADQLIFLLDMEDLNHKTLSDYIEIVQRTRKPYYLVATKCDLLWDSEWEISDENYEKLKEKVEKVLSNYLPGPLKKGCKGDVMCVMIFTEKSGEREGCPKVMEGRRLLSLGYDRVLEVLGGAH